MSGPEIETPQSLWMRLTLHLPYTLTFNHDYIIICTKLLIIKQQLGHVYGKRQWRVNGFWSCK
jgi:hypothetical protein